MSDDKQYKSEPAIDQILSQYRGMWCRQYTAFHEPFDQQGSTVHWLQKHHQNISSKLLNYGCRNYIQQRRQHKLHLRSVLIISIFWWKNTAHLLACTLKKHIWSTFLEHRGWDSLQVFACKCLKLTLRRLDRLYFEWCIYPYNIWTKSGGIYHSYLLSNCTFSNFVEHPLLTTSKRTGDSFALSIDNSVVFLTTSQTISWKIIVLGIKETHRAEGSIFRGNSHSRANNFLTNENVTEPISSNGFGASGA